MSTNYKITNFVDCEGREREAVCVAWPDVERVLGREYEGRDEDGSRLRSALSAAGAPDWVGSSDGYLTSRGWYLLRRN